MDFKKNQFFMPAEWVPHSAVWIAWPSHGNLWEENLLPAQKEFAELCRNIADVDPVTGKARGESLEVLVPSAAARKQAEEALKGLPVRFHSMDFGDIWLRDTGPLFLKNPAGRVVPLAFRFNGWGEKYVLKHDDKVAGRIAEITSKPLAMFSQQKLILEGGSIDLDGEGTCLTTKQCLLNPNRNPALSQVDIENALKETLGISKFLWLNEGLVNDHTDGHIDTLARFVAPATVVCMEARSSDDPNAEILKTIAQDLEKMTDARGRKLKVIRIPSPGKLLNEDGDVMPASYVNFYIANTTVIVPVYGSSFDAQAVGEIAKLFPGRRTVGVSAKAILSGGGAFHCITQQQPQGEANE